MLTNLATHHRYRARRRLYGFAGSFVSYNGPAANLDREMVLRQLAGVGCIVAERKSPVYDAEDHAMITDTTEEMDGVCLES